MGCAEVKEFGKRTGREEACGHYSEGISQAFPMAYSNVSTIPKLTLDKVLSSWSSKCASVFIVCEISNTKVSSPQ
jgi:hypothetical protein